MSVRFRTVAVLWTSMIEAAIYKDGQLQRGDEEVWLAWKTADVAFDRSYSAEDLRQNSEQTLLRTRPGTLYPGHDRAPFFDSEDVDQRLSSELSFNCLLVNSSRRQVGGCGEG